MRPLLLGLLAALASAALADVPPPPAAAPGDQAYADATAASKAGDRAGALAAYQSCLKEAPARRDCRWDLGWTYWKQGDWQSVVDVWSVLLPATSAEPGLDKYLQDAKDALAAKQKLAVELSHIPDTKRPPLPKGTTLRLRAVGDVMLGTTFPDGYLPPDDGAHSLDAVDDLLRDADVTFGNLEGPLCDHGETNKCAPGSNCYAFRVPTRYGKYLKDAGFDVMSTANNHNGDFGDVCRRETEQTLDGLGIKWSGAPGSIALLDVSGEKVAVVGFHTSPQTNDVNDVETAKQLVRLARSEADYVVVSFHGGAEGSKATHVYKGHELFLGEDRGDLPTFTHAVIDAGADLVLGHGPHVTRAMEVYQGHLIAYSLGNFATYGRFNLSGPMSQSLVLEVTLDEKGRFTAGKILPVKQVDKGIPQPDPDAASIGAIRTLSQADFPETMPVIADDGTIRPR